MSILVAATGTVDSKSGDNSGRSSADEIQRKFEVIYFDFKFVSLITGVEFEPD